MANSHARVMYPGLAGFYDSMLPLAETFMRIVVGIMFLMHVSGKFTAGCRKAMRLAVAATNMCC